MHERKENCIPNMVEEIGISTPYEYVIDLDDHNLNQTFNDIVWTVFKTWTRTIYLVI